STSAKRPAKRLSACRQSSAGKRTSRSSLDIRHPPCREAASTRHLQSCGHPHSNLPSMRPERTPDTRAKGRWKELPSAANGDREKNARRRLHTHSPPAAEAV